MNTKLKKLIYRMALGGRTLVAAATLSVVAGQFIFSRPATAGEKEKEKNPPARLNIDNTAPKRDARMTSSFSPVVKQVSASVVKVYTSTKPKQREEGVFEDPRFRFFGNPFGLEGRPGMKSPRQHGLGSGVIVSKDGYILTNNHVVENADEVKVALADGEREFTAKVVGTDPKTDIAVLKVDASDLESVSIADSDLVEVGDVVLAIGNPFGIGQTVTSGIISATGRSNMGIDYEDFLQTDAAINPGNSGGALVDAQGRLIGINTAILSRTGGNQGIGFAIPSNLARHTMDSLIRDGHVVRGYMGVVIQDVTPALAKEFKLADRGGALVAEVAPKSPAEKAGLESGDVITELNGKTIKTSRQLRLEVSQTSPGTDVKLKVSRDGKLKTFNVALKELPGSELASDSGKKKDSEEDDALDGVVVGDLTPAARRESGLPKGAAGAIVTAVEPNSAAFEAGLREGDVIVEIDRKSVKSAEDAVEMTKNVKDKRVLLRVWSRGASRFVVVDESKAG